ncbi:hypothetical protein X777_10276, partial [Ooceraea biroi]
MSLFATMPSCCVKYCTSRTSYKKTQNVKYLRFPKDGVIRQQWLDACQNNGIRTGVPTYTELVEYVQEKQRLRHKESMQNMEVEAVEDINDTNCIEEVDCITTETMQHMELENDTTNIETNKRLQKSEEINCKTLKEKELLEQQNVQLRMEVTKLQTEILKMSTDKQKQEIDILKKVFTPGQIARLTSSTNSRIQWSPEDIVSAISLRSSSPKAYKYLRNVKK